MEKILLDEKYEQLLFQIPLLRDLPHNIKQSLLEKLEYSVYSIDKKDMFPVYTALPVQSHINCLHEPHYSQTGASSSL